MISGENRLVDWKKYAAVTVSVSAALFAFWVLMRYGIGVLLPFLLAWVLSLLLTPISELVAKKTRIPKRLCAAILLLCTLALVLCVVVFALNRLFREIDGILQFLSENPDSIGNAIQRMVDYFSEIGNKAPFFAILGEIEVLEGLIGDMGEVVSGLLKETITSMSARIPDFIVKVISGTPSAILFSLVFLISAFYFCLDGDRIYAGIRGMLPSKLSARLVGFRKRITFLLYRYLRVYLLLFLLTFTELLIGFLILGQRYAFLLALLISAMDILPVLGVGTVLVPWALLHFLWKDFHGAIGLLVLWGAITMIRQIVEPRLIGESFGMHPLLALVALYAGLKLFGVVGLLFGPAIAVFVRLALTELRRGSAGEASEESSRESVAPR